MPPEVREQLVRIVVELLVVQLERRAEERAASGVCARVAEEAEGKEQP
jgi:hypothetical protein